MTSHSSEKLTLETIDALFEIPLLSALDFEGRCALQYECRVASFDACEEVIGFDDSVSDVFFVLRGSVHVSIQSSTGSSVPLGAFAAGHYFGELAAIDERPQAALIETLEPTLIAVCPAHVFRAAVLDNPDAARQLVLDLATVIRKSSARIVRVRLSATHQQSHRNGLEGSAMPVQGNVLEGPEGPPNPNQ